MLQSMELQKVGHDLATKQQFLQVCWIYLGGREEAGCSFFISSFFGHWSHSWNLVPQLDMDISLIRMKVKATQSCQTLCDPMDIQSMKFSMDFHRVHEILEWVVAFPFSGGSSQPRLQVDSLPAELLGKPKLIRMFWYWTRKQYYILHLA